MSIAQCTLTLIGHIMIDFSNYLVVPKCLFEGNTSFHLYMCKYTMCLKKRPLLNFYITAKTELIPIILNNNSVIIFNNIPRNLNIRKL